MLPDFIVIGAQKAGSTFILNCLAEHPDVFMYHEEIRFFENPTCLHNDLSELEALFTGIDTAQMVLNGQAISVDQNVQIESTNIFHIPNSLLYSVILLVGPYRHIIIQ